VYSFALNSGVALVLWLLVPAMGALWPIWVRSQFIGGSITALALGIGLMPAVHRLAGLRAVAVMLLPAVPLGYLIGMRLSGWLLDDPSELGRGAEVTTGAILATGLASALAGLVLWGRQRIRGEEVARQQAQRLAAEAELRLLRAQLEPHMLFNTLANLRELMAENPPAAQAAGAFPRGHTPAPESGVPSGWIRATRTGRIGPHASRRHAVQESGPCAAHSPACCSRPCLPSAWRRPRAPQGLHEWSRCCFS
jgi:hypothetical protein